MTDYRNLEQQLTETLGIDRRPVAVIFRESPPAGVTHLSGAMPSGCSFWRLAAEGRTFYTIPDDHYNCPIGSYTHNLPLPAERTPELEQALSLMTGVGYLKMEEVPGIYRLDRTPGAVIYAPLADTPADPDVVLVAGQPGRLMILGEAALSASVGMQSPLLGRPTCMALPAALGHGTVASLGCIGNRVYTGLGEDELYVVIPGKDLEIIVSRVRAIAEANTQMAAYHRGRRQTLTAV
jgi:uncharacterized protein (DUF169 family)